MKATFILPWQMSLHSRHRSEAFRGLKSLTVPSASWLCSAKEIPISSIISIFQSALPPSSDFVLGFLFITNLEKVKTKQSQCCFTGNNEWTPLLLGILLTIWLSLHDHSEHSRMDDGRAHWVPPLSIKRAWTQEGDADGQREVGGEYDENILYAYTKFSKINEKRIHRRDTKIINEVQQ